MLICSPIADLLLFKFADPIFWLMLRHRIQTLQKADLLLLHMYDFGITQTVAMLSSRSQPVHLWEAFTPLKLFKRMDVQGGRGAWNMPLVSTFARNMAWWLWFLAESAFFKISILCPRSAGNPNGPPATSDSPFTIMALPTGQEFCTTLHVYIKTKYNAETETF
jgi:hypothetical protein